MCTYNRSGPPVADVRMRLFEYVVQSALVPSFLVGHIDHQPINVNNNTQLQLNQPPFSGNNGSTFGFGPSEGVFGNNNRSAGGVPQLDELSAVLLGGVLGPNPDAFMDLLNNDPSTDDFFDFPSDEHDRETAPTAGTKVAMLLLLFS
jgi:hypothetical protein